jgi:hypothetical protein
MSGLFIAGREFFKILERDGFFLWGLGAKQRIAEVLKYTRQ